MISFPERKYLEEKENQPLPILHSSLTSENTSLSPLPIHAGGVNCVDRSALSSLAYPLGSQESVPGTEDSLVVSFFC
jgi:hypothetical protein